MDKSAPKTLTFCAPLVASGRKLRIVMNACLAPPCLPLVVAAAPPSRAYIGGDALVGDAMGARGGGGAVWLYELPFAVAALAIAKRRAEARTGRRKRRKRSFALLSMAMGEGEGGM
uniref:Uncharacterized protein n=1 Tax=Triticum urartu TaxID=4572 RepID=A0A8R7Q565_TRIUA